MEREDVEELVAAMLAERDGDTHPDDNRPEMLMPVAPFKATGTDNERIEVIGIGYLEGDLQFVCLISEGDEIWPSMREHVYREVVAPA